MQDAAKIGAVMEGITIIDPATDPRLSTYIDELVEARKKKGLSRDQAADLLADENYFATMMVRCGDADGLVSGAIHTTAATVRPGMQVQLLSRAYIVHFSGYCQIQCSLASE
jgi:phosphate acetyltransferase